MEHAVEKQIRRTRINAAIIKTLAVTGMLAVTLMAPNALQVLRQFGITNPKKKKQDIHKSLDRLIGSEYVRRVAGHIELTQKGERFAALLGEGRLAPKRPKRWDGKWRVLIFDIPERRKRIREQIRRNLVGLGFFRLQDSVWVYPYDCEDLITLLKADLRVGKDMLYLISDIEADRSLRKVFKLT